MAEKELRIVKDFFKQKAGFPSLRLENDKLLIPVSRVYTYPATKSF